MVGRFGNERLPRVYSGLVFGWYFWRSRSIALLGFVSQRPVPESWLFYLRLHTLMTLVHEIAHHEDHTRRVARDRWLGSDSHRNEWYAEQRAWVWQRDAVFPYLREAYPAELVELEQWMLTNVGVALQLATLAGDPRCHSKELGQFYSQTLCSSSAQAFEEFVRALDRGDDLAEARLNLAIGLRRAEQYTESLRVLEVILYADPANVPALVQQAWIKQDLGELDAAHITLERSIALDPTCGAAWAQMANVLARRKDWRGVVDAADKAILFADVFWRPTMMRMLKGRALFELGEYARARTVVSELFASNKQIEIKHGWELLDELRQRAKELERASQKDHEMRPPLIDSSLTTGNATD